MLHDKPAAVIPAGGVTELLARPQGCSRVRGRRGVREHPFFAATLIAKKAQGAVRRLRGKGDLRIMVTTQVASAKQVAKAKASRRCPLGVVMMRQANKDGAEWDKYPKASRRCLQRGEVRS